MMSVTKLGKTQRPRTVGRQELQLVAERKHLPEVLKLPPISNHGNVIEIISKFGGADQLRNAVNQLQSLLNAA